MAHPQDWPGHLDRLGEAAHRCPIEEHFRLHRIVDDERRQARVDDPGRQAVDPDAEMSELHGRGLHDRACGEGGRRAGVDTIGDPRCGDERHQCLVLVIQHRRFDLAELILQHVFDGLRLDAVPAHLHLGVDTAEEMP